MPVGVAEAGLVAGFPPLEQAISDTSATVAIKSIAARLIGLFTAHLTLESTQHGRSSLFLT